MNKKLNILIADDHEMVRFGFKALFSEVPIVNQVFEASNGKEVLDIIKKNKIDAVFLDIEMPVMTGIEALDIIRSTYGDESPKIIILSMFSHRQYLLDLYKRGISGYILKETTVDELIRALTIIMDGQQYYSAKVSDILFQSLLKKPVSSQQILGASQLSNQEIQVLALICEQKTCEEIADQLFRSVLTIKKHRQNIILKTGSENTVGLVLYALRNGIFEL